VPLRTFLALDVDAAVRERLPSIAGGLQVGRAKLRPVPPENIHVTLNFLGDVADAALGDVCRAVADVGAASEPFTFTVRGVRCMPPKGRVNILWADVADPEARLAGLQGELTEAMSALGFRPDARTYHPHLTIARVKYAADPRALRQAVAPFADEDFGPQRAERVTTYTSELTPRGAVYIPAARAALGGTGTASG